MTNTSFLAPIIRGALIQKIGRPWAVCAASQNTTVTTTVPLITIPAGRERDETVTTEIVLTALKPTLKSGIPSIIQALIGGETITFFTAPNCATAEKFATNPPLWTGTDIESFSSRADTVKDRISLVTGGAQGFGEEIVRGLVSTGATVFIADLNVEGAQKLAEKLNTEYGKTIAYGAEVNVADEDSVEALFDTIVQTAGGIDLCVSNAGVLRASSILEQDIKSFRFVTDINYTAFAVVSKHCALTVKRQNAACPDWTTDIIQINSKSGLEGSNKNGSYAGGKFGGIGLVQSFAMELVTFGIKVNAICPGNFFDGPLWSDPEKGLFVQYLNTGKVPGSKTLADVKSFYEAKVPMNRGCSGIDVLRAIYYLVEQKYETGQAIPVTGGQCMLN